MQWSDQKWTLAHFSTDYCNTPAFLCTHTFCCPFGAIFRLQHTFASRLTVFSTSADNQLGLLLLLLLWESTRSRAELSTEQWTELSEQQKVSRHNKLPVSAHQCHRCCFCVQCCLHALQCTKKSSSSSQTLNRVRSSVTNLDLSWYMAANSVCVCRTLVPAAPLSSACSLSLSLPPKLAGNQLSDYTVNCAVQLNWACLQCAAVPVFAIFALFFESSRRPTTTSLPLDWPRWAPERPLQKN